MKNGWLIRVLLLLLAASGEGFAQNVLYVKVVELYSNAYPGDTDGDIEHTWRFHVREYAANGTATPSATTWRLLSTCFSQTNKQRNTWYSFNKNLTIGTYSYSSMPTKLRIQLEGFEDQVGDRCSFHDGKDRLREHYETEFNLNQLQPGQWSSVTTFGSNYYYAKVQVYYGINTPTAPKLYANGSPTEYTTTNGALCKGEDLLKLTTEIPYSPYNTSNTNFIWEYNIQGEEEEVNNPNYCGPCYVDPYDPYYYEQPCCSEPPTIWQPKYRYFNTSSASPTYGKGETTFYVSDLPGLADYLRLNLATNEVASIRFRVRAVAGAVTTEESAISTAFAYNYPPAPDFLVTERTASCPSPNATGSVTFSVNGIANDYVLELFKDGAAVVVPNNFGLRNGSHTVGNLGAGSYQLVLRNSSNRCSGTNSKPFTIDPLPPLAYALNPSGHVSCPGGSDGVISVTGVGGKGPYAYKISTAPDAWQDSGTFQNLGSGSYTVTVKDACNTETPTGTIQITEPTPVVATTTYTNPACYSGQGTVRAEGVSGGSGKYSYAIASTAGAIVAQYPAPGGVTTETSWEKTDLPAGDYILSIIDADRPTCPGFSYNFTITIPTPPALSIAAGSQKAVTCSGSSDGEIGLTASGGTAPYTVSLPGSGTKTGPNASFTALTAGNYTATVTDAKGCQGTLSFQITEPPPLALTLLNQKLISCKDAADGEISLQPTGGSGNYTVQVFFNEGSGEIALGTSVTSIGAWWQYAAASQTITVARAFPASYRVVLRDNTSTDCTTSLTIAVTEPTLPLTLSAPTVLPVTCFGAGDGKIIPSASGGWGNYTYQYSLQTGSSWTAYANFTAQTPFAPGSYKIRVLDSGNCQFEYASTITITQAGSPLTATYSLSDYNGYQVSCAGGANGSVTVTATGGMPFADAAYQYKADGGAYQSSNVLSGLSEGSHTIYTKDANGCVITKLLTLTAPNTITVSVTGKQMIDCAGAATGAITAAGTGGVLPYLYSVDNRTFQPGNVLSNLKAGIYTVYVKDAQGCTSSLAGVQLVESNPILIDFAVRNASCNGLSDGALQATVTGGNLGYTYRWTGRAETTPSLTGLSAGTYTLQVTDSKGCTTEKQVQVGEPMVLVATASNALNPSCAGRQDGSAAVAITGGTPPYQVHWSDGRKQQTVTATGLGAGSYTARVTDAKGCSATAALTLTDPITTIDLGGPYTLCLNQKLPLDAGYADATYQWTSTDGFSSANRHVELTRSGAYHLTVTTAEGCIRQGTVVVNAIDRAFAVKFLVGTRHEVGDTVEVTEVCYPAPDKLTWNFGPKARLLNSSLSQPQVTYPDTGQYIIKLTAQSGPCIDSVYKIITFLPQGTITEEVAGAATAGHFKQIQVFPNPTDGNFTLELEMESVQDVDVMLFDIYGTRILSKPQTGAAYYRASFSILDMPPGTYLLKLVAGSQQKVIRITVY